MQRIESERQILKGQADERLTSLEIKLNKKEADI